MQQASAGVDATGELVAIIVREGVVDLDDPVVSVGGFDGESYGIFLILPCFAAAHAAIEFRGGLLTVQALHGVLLLRKAVADEDSDVVINPPTNRVFGRAVSAYSPALRVVSSRLLVKRTVWAGVSHRYALMNLQKRIAVSAALPTRCARHISDQEIAANRSYSRERRADRFRDGTGSCPVRPVVCSVRI
jgi:hypothetical protein